MTEKPGDAGGSGRGEEITPWPVVDRSMINYGVPPPMSAPTQAAPVQASGARWPGVVLVLAGFLLCCVAVVDWIANLVRALRGPEPGIAEMLGPELPSGLPTGVVHAGAFAAGVLLTFAGATMNRKGCGIASQTIWLMSLSGAVVVLVIMALGGAPFTVLLPDFSP